MPLAEISVPGSLELLFLAWMLIGLPLLAIRSARKVREALARDPDQGLPPRISIWMGTVVMLAGLFVFAGIVAGEPWIEAFALPALGLREILAVLAALLLLLAIHLCLCASRSEAERRELVVYKLAPRGAREWMVWSAMVVVASIAEEAAYRGVLMSILEWIGVSAWIAALISAVAFAAAHWMQGWKSGLAIFAIALVMHGLVAITHT